MRTLHLLIFFGLKYFFRDFPGIFIIQNKIKCALQNWHYGVSLPFIGVCPQSLTPCLKSFKLFVVFLKRVGQNQFDNLLEKCRLEL